MREKSARAEHGEKSNVRSRRKEGHEGKTKKLLKRRRRSGSRMKCFHDGEGVRWRRWRFAGFCT